MGLSPDKTSNTEVKKTNAYIFLNCNLADNQIVVREFVTFGFKIS